MGATNHGKRLARTVAVLAIGALAVVACGSGAHTAADSAAPGTTAVSTPDVCTAERVGGAITMGVYTETQGLDPAVSSGSGEVGGTELSAIYDTLMRWDPTSGNYEPRLAESLTPNADFTEWTLKLRQGVKFGNGDAFTTAAIAANFERHKDPNTKSPHRVLALFIDSTRIVDERNIVIKLTQPWSEFPYLLSSQNLGMVPNPRVITELGAEQFNRAPVGAGAGPYEVTQFVPGEKIVMRAKTDYWNGPVCVQDLTFVARGASSNTYDALRVGDINVGIIDDAQVLQRVRDAGTKHASQLLNGQGIMINNGVRDSQTPFRDASLRLAVQAALDPEALDQRITAGTAEATSAIFSKKSTYSTNTPGPAYDATKARALVTEAKAKGLTTKVNLVCTQPQASQALAVKTALDSVGFDVQIETVATTTDQIRVVVTEARYDLACWSMQVFDAGAWVKLDRFLSSKSPSNRSGYANPQMDAALTDLRLASDPAARKTVLDRVQKIWNETAPSAVIRAGEPTVLWADAVHGLVFNGEVIVHFDKAYVKR